LSVIRLINARVYDPINGVDGLVQDVWIQSGSIIAPIASLTGAIRTIDLSGRVIMPGAIDMHTHVAGPKVNVARKMQPEQNRIATVSSRWAGKQFIPSGTLASVPSIYATGLKYAELGYTTCFDAAVTPLSARHVHHEFQDMPILDTGFYTLVGNNHFAMQSIAAGDQSGLDAFLGWLLCCVGSYAPKLVNPGGVELWKQSVQGNARDLDQIIHGFHTTPRKIIQAIAESANRIGLPHPIHIHSNNLGLPGNWTTTLETMKCLEDLKGHLTHVQFHSYGGGDADPDSVMSKVQPLADYINSHPNLTVDVGQVMFGRTMSMTGDAPLGHCLQKLSRESWYSADVELESGCGVSPIEYRNKNFVHSLQWAIGLEWFLLVSDPWQIVMTTDHPNGGSFWAYPQIVRLLMDRSYRAEMLAMLNPKVLEHSALPDLNREYTLYEIAIITRAAPAKILGLPQKGHLGLGADADIVVYSPQQDYETMFSNPWMVIKGGEILLEQGELRRIVAGKTIAAKVGYDTEQAKSIESWFDEHYSLKSIHYGIKPFEFSRLGHAPSM
jgi:formylmethanofuran dehydrogenase subunit A